MAMNGPPAMHVYVSWTQFHRLQCLGLALEGDGSMRNVPSGQLRAEMLEILDAAAMLNGGPFNRQRAERGEEVELRVINRLPRGK